MRLLRLLTTVTRLPAWFRSALTDPASADVAVLWSLTLYVIVWTAYGTIAKGGQGLHPDMTEIVAWSPMIQTWL